MANKKKVFVSGCYDMLHSGHVAFFRAAAQYGDLYVGIGSDATILELKHRKTIYSERERLYMVKAIRYVTDAFINPGSGYLDFVETVDRVKPDVFVVNTDGGSEDKRRFCAERGIEYVELERVPDDGMTARSTTSLRTNVHSQLPYRLDLAGTWIDQPYVSEHGAGWAITISLEPTAEFMERGGMSTARRYRRFGPTSCLTTTRRCWRSWCFASRMSRRSKNMCRGLKMPSAFVCPV
jgi:cytidyltransferase-like protein